MCRPTDDRVLPGAFHAEVGQSQRPVGLFLSSLEAATIKRLCEQAIRERAGMILPEEAAAELGDMRAVLGKIALFGIG